MTSITKDEITATIVYQHLHYSNATVACTQTNLHKERGGKPHTERQIEREDAHTKRDKEKGDTHRVGS